MFNKFILLTGFIMFVNSLKNRYKINQQHLGIVHSWMSSPYQKLAYRLSHIHSKSSRSKSKLLDFEIEETDFDVKKIIKARADVEAKYIPKSHNQTRYYQFLNNKDVDMVVCHGPAGTGKTMFACNAAVQQLKNGNIKKIVLTRPAVSVDEDLGFLPGNIACKMDPWTRPIFDVLSEFYTKRDIDDMMKGGVIEISPLAFMRGRTFKHAFIIADEMQNSSPNQMMMLTTRIGVGSKMAITGDLLQSDRCENNGLLDFIRRLNIYKPYGIEMVELGKEDVFRSEVVSRVLELYDISLSKGAPKAPHTPIFCSSPLTPVSSSLSSSPSSKEETFGISTVSSEENILVDEALRAAEEVEAMEEEMARMERNSELEVSAYIGDTNTDAPSSSSMEENEDANDVIIVYHENSKMDSALIPKGHMTANVMRYFDNKEKEITGK